MSTMDRRLTMLEQADPPAVARALDETFESFQSRMKEALLGLPADASHEEWRRTIHPWLEAMTHIELREFRDALEANLRTRPHVPASTVTRGNP